MRATAMIARVGRMLTRPSSRAIWQVVDDVKTISGPDLWAAGVRGVLLDADGTLVPHLERTFSPEIRAWVASLEAAGLAVAVYSNADDLDALMDLGLPVVRGPKKPAKRGFEAALWRLRLSAAEVVMVGDNLISDGGAVDVGMRFIWCRPLSGNEPWPHRLARGLAARAMG